MSDVERVQAQLNMGADALLGAPIATVHEEIGTVPVAAAQEAATRLGGHLMAIDEAAGALRGQIGDIQSGTSQARFMWNEALQGSSRPEGEALLAVAEDLHEGENGAKGVFEGGLRMLEKLKEVKGVYDQLLEGLGELATMQAGWQDTTRRLMDNATSAETDARTLAASWDG